MIEGKDVLFIGLGATAICWYRCALPAMYMGADWIGVLNEPPNLVMATGIVRGKTAMPNFLDYKAIVIQQPRGKGWLKKIRDLQDRGIKVFFEIDDYVHAIKSMKDHDYREYFMPAELRRLELNMRVCDGMICSTEYIARRYTKFNRNVSVCRIGLDIDRYRLTRPKRPTVNYGWSGATGHNAGVMSWLKAFASVMEKHSDTCLVTIGQSYANAFTKTFGPQRVLSIPFTLIDTYPSAMTLFDVGMAPAGTNAFFQGKSDLRWLEAAALGVPLVADPVVYPEIEDGVTGFHASSPQQAGEILDELATNASLREEVGANARAYVTENRTISHMVTQWEKTLLAGENGA